MLASFGDDLRIMAQRAELDSAAQESLALHQFYKGVCPEMRCRCLDRECRTVLEAVDVVERYDLVLGRDDRRRSTIRMVKGDARETQPAVQEKPKLTLEEQMAFVLTRLEKIQIKLEKQRYNTRSTNNDKTRGRYMYTGYYI